ncbi:MAG TPA: type II secretion system protein GspC [Polyangiales bacterium]
MSTTLVVSGALVVNGLQQLRAPRETAAPAPAQPSRPTRSASPVLPDDPLALGTLVLARNIFDSETGSMSWSNPEDELSTTAGPDAGTGPLSAGAPCADDVRLFASIVNAREPERSLAALRKDGKTHLIPLGGALGDMTLAALYPTHAYLQSQAGAVCYLPVYVSANQAPPPPPEPPPPEPPVAEPAAPATGRRPPAFTEEELRKNIRVLGPQSYAVTKDLFLRARQNPSGISRGTRFAPRTEEGRPSGMQISKIRDDSLLAHLGLKKGDVIRRLNGFNLGTADGVLEAFGHLSKNDRLNLIIERDGKPETLRYLLE